MVDIDVAKPFTLTEEGGVRTHFKAGKQSVDERLANHWYVQAHLVGAKRNPAAASPEHMKAAAEIRQKLEDERARAEAEAEAEVVAAVRARVEAELEERIKASIQEAAENATKGEDARVAARVEELLKERVDAAVAEALTAAGVTPDAAAETATTRKGRGGK